MRISDWIADVCSSYLPRLEQNFGVRARPERHANCAELLRERLVIVDLAIEDDDEAVLLERLIGRVRQFASREPAVAETHVRAVERKSVVSGKGGSVRDNLGVTQYIKNKNNQKK